METAQAGGDPCGGVGLGCHLCRFAMIPCAVRIRESVFERCSDGLDPRLRQYPAMLTVGDYLRDGAHVRHHYWYACSHGL